MTEKPQTNRFRFLRVTLLAAASAFLLTVTGVIVFAVAVAASAPDISKLQWNSSTVILDRQGQEIFRVNAGENRTPVKLSSIPRHVVDAFVAIEDPRFYEHHGINLRGIMRAAWKSGMYVLGMPGGRLEGGSTITQQLARDAWLGQEISMKRKVQEAWVAIQLERKYTKDEIMEMYLNQIYFGHGAYGIEAAANTFFGKSVGELTIAEGAQLAGMINGPSLFDPYQNMKASLERRDLVLDALLKERFIEPSVFEQAKAEQPELKSKNQQTVAESNFFTDYVINILEDAKPGLAEKYGLKLGDVGSIGKAGLKVHTTVDVRLQKLAEQALANQMAQADKEYGLAGKKDVPQAAMVVMNPKTGEVLAVVGGRTHETMLALNRATDSYRQPGSAIKPLVVYTPAIDAGISPATIFDDAPVMLSPDGKTVWPQNFDYKYLGLKSMRFGVEQSLNPIAVEAMQASGGPQKGLEYAQKFGLTSISKVDENLALALGGITKGTTVLDMAAAYSALANLGMKVDPVVITRIEDRSGATIFEAVPQKQLVTKPSSAYMMVDVLKGVIRRGTAYGFSGGFKGWPAAGKTGTTEDNRDAWFVGFTPDVVTAVWNGYDNPVNHLPWTGAFVPVKIWNQFMTQAVLQPSADWARPADVSVVSVCRLTGTLPDASCPQDQIVSELFQKGTEPKTASNLIVRAKAVQVTTTSPDRKITQTRWELWQSGCPGQPVDKVFIRRPHPLVKHPTDPYNPKYVPADAKDELPSTMCQPAPWWERIMPKLPFFGGSGGSDSGASHPGPMTP